MTAKTYGQYCGVARALELVGERWALLVIRNLLVGPKRYTDLKNGLPKIPTNVLATRLKELEAAGLVSRRIEPSPSRAIVYELTPYGAALDTVVLELGRWGARSLGELRPGEIADTDVLVMALRSTFQPAASTAKATYEVRFGEVVVHAVVERDELHVQAGAAEKPTLVIEAFGPLTPLLDGTVTPAEALADGLVGINGPKSELTRFSQLFRI
ncbi:helix-turn-helix domain-containing protein [Kribbella lupini]|uniref:Winged helix-turn-helix transcriptional regulator n=1 Tax=Kribbella lupini TaxID=291602 RepID=A0ABP4M4F0_9ACTN